ncbi:uncharacterized protein LOC144316322 isoform X3 [Canis aureus]
MRMVWAANSLPSAPENMLLRAGSEGLQDGKKHTMEGVQPTPDVRECEDGADDVLCERAELGNCFRKEGSLPSSALADRRPGEDGEFGALPVSTPATTTQQ